MTNMTRSKLSIFSHPEKITVIGLLQDHFHIETHIGPGLVIIPRPILGSWDDNQTNMEMPMY
jgi:hypothetical protein